MNITLCDRCKKVVNDETQTYHVLIERMEAPEPILDQELCLDCEQELLKVYRNGEQNNPIILPDPTGRPRK